MKVNELIKRDTRPRFSIILPVRNGWPYIETAVKSVLNQTYENFELLILDNDSSDGSREWCEKLDDSRIKVFSSAVALNIEDSWGRILSLDKCEFVTMFAHDDILYPDFLYKITQLIEKFPTAGLYQTNGELVNKSGSLIRPCTEIGALESARDYLLARFSGVRDVFGTGYVMRSSDYDSAGGIPKFNGLSFADDALWLGLIKDGFKACSSSCSVSVRVHPNSESATKPSNWYGFLIALRQFSSFLEDTMSKDLQEDQKLMELKNEFFRNYLTNIYILGLVHFASEGEKFPKEKHDLFIETLETLTDSSYTKIKWSLKVLPVFLLHKLCAPLLPLVWWVYKVSIRD